jgi:hypothetical protein
MSDVDCCTQQMEVCRNSNGISSITNIPPTDSYVECEGIYDAYTNPFTQKSYSLPCQPVCDWLDEVPGLFNTKIMIDEQHNDLAIAQYNLKDFYANEQIQISFNSTVQANIEVNVYDITGSFIETEKGSFGAGDSQLTINTNNFKTGSYYYIIVINNTLIKSNKFVIVR